jgi:uncharacterized SAM-binding protein YcdF (DUF218 family)
MPALAPPQMGRPRRARVVVLLLAAPVVAFAAVAISIALYAQNTDDGPADAAIILGAAVENGQPTPVFAERIRHGVDLYRRGRVHHLVLTGGIGAGDQLAESQVARAVCLAQGVPPADIAIETRSRSTHENLSEAKPLLAAQGSRRVLIVSDPLHMRRALTLAHDLGIDALPSPTPTSRYVSLGSRARFLLRESYFYGRYLLFRQ